MGEMRLSGILEATGRILSAPVLHGDDRLGTNAQPPVPKCATPMRKCATPVRKCATPVRKCATPVRKCATPVRKCATPARKCARLCANAPRRCAGGILSWPMRESQVAGTYSCLVTHASCLLGTQSSVLSTWGSPPGALGTTAVVPSITRQFLGAFRHLQSGLPTIVTGSAIVAAVENFHLRRLTGGDTAEKLVATQ